MKKKCYKPTVTTFVIDPFLPLASSGPVKPKSTTNSEMKEAFYHSFFGVDLLCGTGGKWQFVEKRYNEQGDAIFNFKLIRMK